MNIRRRKRKKVQWKGKEKKADRVLLETTLGWIVFFLIFHLSCLVDLRRLSRQNIMFYHVIFLIYFIICHWVLCMHKHLLVLFYSLILRLLLFPYAVSIHLLYSFPTRFHSCPLFLSHTVPPFSSISFLTRFYPSPLLLSYTVSPFSFPFLHGFHHTGDTPNCITDAEFESMGEVSEGYSGSDIAIVVRQVKERRGTDMLCVWFWFYFDKYL